MSACLTHSHSHTHATMLLLFDPPNTKNQKQEEKHTCWGQTRGFYRLCGVQEPTCKFRVKTEHQPPQVRVQVLQNQTGTQTGKSPRTAPAEPAECGPLSETHFKPGGGGGGHSPHESAAAQMSRVRLQSRIPDMVESQPAAR